MVVEDDEAVEAVVLGDVRGRYRVGAPDAAEDVLGCHLLGCAERVPTGLLDLTAQGVRPAAAPPPPPATSKGREARSSLKRAPSRVTRFVTLTILCSRTASTEPKVFSTQPRISSGISRRPVVAHTSNRRSAISRSSGGKPSMRASRSVILRSGVLPALNLSSSTALFGMRFAVGRVARQPVAIDGDEVVEAILKPTNAGQPVKGEREPDAERDRQRSVDRRRAPIAAPGLSTGFPGFDGPSRPLALLYAQAGRGGDAGLLIRHHRHAAVAVERRYPTRRPRSKPSRPVEDQNQPLGQPHQAAPSASCRPHRSR